MPYLDVRISIPGSFDAADKIVALLTQYTMTCDFVGWRRSGALPLHTASTLN